MKLSLTLESWHLRVKGISETKVGKSKQRISPKTMQSAKRQSQDWACHLTHSKLCCLLCVLLTRRLPRFSGCSSCSILGELSISDQLCHTVPTGHVCHQGICENVLVSSLTTLRKGALEKASSCAGPVVEKQSRGHQQPRQVIQPRGPEHRNKPRLCESQHSGSPDSKKEVISSFCA